MGFVEQNCCKFCAGRNARVFTVGNIQDISRSCDADSLDSGNPDDFFCLLEIKLLFLFRSLFLRLPSTTFRR